MADTKHQWVLIATYEYSDEEIEEKMSTQRPAALRYENLLDITGPACFRCEAFWDEGHGTPCRGGPRMPKADNLQITRMGLTQEIIRER